MTEWKMLTLVGQDRPGIVARVARALFEGGYTLGEASMTRLGASFTILMMVAGGRPGADLGSVLDPVAAELGLRVHVDPLEGGLHRHLLPNVSLRVLGADRAGIVAEVTAILAAQGCNILELESDVAGDEHRPVYIMNIQCCCPGTIEDLDGALAGLADHGISVDLAPVELLVG